MWWSCQPSKILLNSITMEDFKALLEKTTCEHLYSTKFIIIRIIMQLQWALHLHWVCWILFLWNSCVHWCAVFHIGFWMTFHFKSSHFHLLQLWSMWWRFLEVISEKQYVKMDIQCFGNCQCLHHSHNILWIHSIMIQLNAWQTFHLLQKLQDYMVRENNHC